MVDEKCLRNALERQGYTVPAGRAKISGWNGQSRLVDVGIPDLGNGYGVGFERKGTSPYMAVADWSELSFLGIKQRDFVNSVSQAYGIEATLASMQPQGYAVSEQRKEANGSVRIVMRRVS
jgi:hypothetical protein